MDEKREVVISGIGGAFAGCSDFGQLAKNILANEYLVERSETVWNYSPLANVEPVAGKMPRVRREACDNNFFSIHNKLGVWTDAVAMTCYERSFEAVIDAGISPASIYGSNAEVYFGAYISDNEAGSLEGMLKAEGYSIMGHNRGQIPNRVSYFFGFTGHSCAFNSAEAFGPLGIRMAAEAVAIGRCDAALVVGCATLACALTAQMYKDMGFLSQDFFCHPFEETASGMHRSECCVAFLLQPAALAKRCYAKVVGAGAMHLSHRPGFDVTLPSPAGIESFISDMYRDNGVDPRAVAYMEADGVGHRILDETELNVFDAVLCRDRPAGQPLLVGSVKSNVGHTEVCSGLVGVAKAVVAMEAGVIPATINHVKDLASARGLAEGRLKVVTENTPMEIRSDTCVGVNTLSLCGQVGHVILQPNPKAKKLVADPSQELPRLVLLSGRTEETLAKVTETVRASPFDPEYFCLLQNTFGPSIRGYQYRSYIVFPVKPEQPINIAREDPRSVVFVYSGMGSQWAGMGTALMALPLFADTIERLHGVLAEKGLDLKTIISETGPEAFDNILKSFVGITACQIALTNVLSAVGLRPELIIGHSVGELGCAYADGCLTETQAILAAWARGRASNEATLTKGMMAAVGLGYKDVVRRLPPTVEVACHNSAASCTLSGPAEDVKQFVSKLESEGVFARAVNVSDIAYHSRYIAPAAPFLRRYLEDVIPEPKARSSKWVSTSVPKHLLDTPAATHCSAEYQTNNLLNPVLFEEALSSVPEDAMLVEIAPHGLLQAILKRALPNQVHMSLAQRGNADPVRFLLEKLGSMTFHGAQLDVAKLYPEVSFPVSRGTPPISTLATWHPGVLYYQHRHLEKRHGSFAKSVHSKSPGMSFGGSRMLVCSEVLDVAWAAQGVLVDEPDVAVCFTNLVVKDFLELDSNPLEVLGKVAKGLGSFEVEEHHGGQVLMAGRVAIQDKEAPPPAPSDEPYPTDAITVTGQDVLDDLVGMGLTYTNSSTALKAVLISDREWIVHLDGASPRAAILEALLQVLQYRASEEATGLVLLKRLRRLEIDLSKIRGQDEVVVRYTLATGVMAGDGIYVVGFVGQRMDKPGEGSLESPLNFQFLRYRNSNLQSLGEFVSLAVQLTLDSVPAAQPQGDCGVTILELQSGNSPNVLGSAVRSVLEKKTGVKVDARTLIVGPGRTLLLPDPEQAVCLTVCAPSTLTEGVRVATRHGGLLLTRTPERLAALHCAMALVAEQRVDGDWVSLLRRPVDVAPERASVMQMARGQAAPARVPQAGPDHPVILVWRGPPDAGVPHVIDQVRRRPYALHARLVFILDEEAPAFSLKEPAYAEQLRLQLRVNVLHRQAWGCWLALPLGSVAPAALSSSSLEGTSIEAYGLNPLDRGGPCGMQSMSGNLDFVGQSPDGKRIMGVARWQGDSNRPRLDSVLQWEVPGGWSSTDAATVPYTYAFAYDALVIQAHLLPGESVLIHEGASAVGQAALRVAMQLGCTDIFTTVATEAQRHTVRLLFPQIPACRVMSCADGSVAFEWQIRRMNNGRGVKVVLSSLPGEQLKASSRLLLRRGRVMNYGREDMLSNTIFGLNVFIRSAHMTGFTGDRLFVAREEDRRAVQQLVQQGIESGDVQPIEGVRVLRAPSMAGITEALIVRGDSPAANKVVMTVQETSRQDGSSANKSYVVVGGQHQEWLQVAGWLAQHGAREVVVVGASSSPSVVRHRVRALRRLFGTNVHVELEDGLSWNEASARRVLQSAASAAPVDAVVALVKDDATVATAMHAALLKEGLRDTALVVLAASAQTACDLAELCEGRRADGLRAACLAGPLLSAAAHMADLLSGARPAVTLLPAPATHARHERPGGVPGDAQALLEVGRQLAARVESCRVRELPTRGRRARHAREAIVVFAVAPLGALDQLLQADLAAFAQRLNHPLMVVEAPPAHSLSQQAAAVVEAIVRSASVGPYNVLGWGLGTPLVLEACRQLEAQGHNAVTMLVFGDVLSIKAWAQEQTDASLLRTVFQDKSAEVLENAPLAELLASLPQRQRAHVEEGFRALRTAVSAVARHHPNVSDPFRGRLVDLQTGRESSFPWAKNFYFHTAPSQEAQMGLRSAWLATLLMDKSGFAKEATETEIRASLKV